MEDAGPAYERQILSESEINSCNSSGSEDKTKQQDDLYLYLFPSYQSTDR